MEVQVFCGQILDGGFPLTDLGTPLLSIPSPLPSYSHNHHVETLQSTQKNKHLPPSDVHMRLPRHTNNSSINAVTVVTAPENPRQFY